MALRHEQTSSTYNRCMARGHLVFEYGNVIDNAPRLAFHSLEPEAAATKSLRRPIPNDSHNESNIPQESKSSHGLESWEGVSPAKSVLVPLLPDCRAPVVVSTPQHTGRRCGSRKPLQIIEHKPHSPLPPSSPPEPSSQVKNPVELLEDNWGADIDPFGFFAAEKRLKARKAVFPPRFIPKVLVEISSFSEGDSFVGEAFAVQRGQLLRRDEPEPSHLVRQKRPASDTPSLCSNFTKSSCEPSSPCQRVGRRKPGAYEDNEGKKVKSRAKKAKKNPKPIAIELEALLPKWPKRCVRQQVRATGNEARTGDGKIKTRNGTDKTTRAQATMLSHSADEARKVFFIIDHDVT